MNLKMPLILFLISLGFGCQGANFGGGRISKFNVGKALVEDADEEVEPQPNDSTTSASDIKVDENDETVDEPVMIGGTMLVCNMEPSVPHDGDVYVMGCGVHNADGTKFRIRPPVTADRYVTDAADTRTNYLIEPVADDSSPYHWYFHIPFGEAAGATIHVDLKNTTTGEEKALSHDMDGVDLRPSFLFFAGLSDVIMGNSLMDAGPENPDCTQREVDFSNDPAKRLGTTAPFSLSQGASSQLVDFELERFCGITAGNTLENRILLLENGTVVREIGLPGTPTTSLRVNNILLKKGAEYRLVFEADKFETLDGYDSVYIKNLKIYSQSPIGGKPAP